LPPAAVDVDVLRGGSVFRFERFSMSMLASVVSDGSPGSSLAIEGPSATPLPVVAWLSVMTPERVRARFVGGTLLAASIDFLCLPGNTSGTADSSPSSPEASRDEGCNWSAVEGLGSWSARREELLRLRLPAVLLGEEGDDMVVEGALLRKQVAAAGEREVLELLVNGLADSN